MIQSPPKLGDFGGQEDCSFHHSYFGSATPQNFNVGGWVTELSLVNAVSSSGIIPCQPLLRLKVQTAFVRCLIKSGN
jgi:hypothetical protein